MVASMPRRLVDQDGAREQRRQALLLDRLARQFRGIVAKDLEAASLELIERWEATGDVPPPTRLAEALEATYKRMVTASVQTFGKRVWEQGKTLALPLEMKEEDFAAFMTRMALLYVQQEVVRARITNVSDTTRSLIVAAIERGFSDGSTTAEIAKDLRSIVPSLSRMRADVIARTETHGAANYGANEAAKRTGLPLRKEWNASHDENTRDTHSEADGQVVGMDELFEVGDGRLAYPGDPSGPAQEVINCRCALSHIVQDEEF